MKALRIAKWLLALLLSTLLLLILLVSWLTGSGGTRFIADLVDSVPGVELVYGGGSLDDEILIDSLVFVTDDGEVSVALEALRLRPDLSCLWRAEICLKSANAQFF